MGAPKPEVYEFDDFRVDAVRRLLLQCGEPVALKPRVFDTLLYLARNSGRVLGKDELMHAIWPDTFVEENNLNQNVSTLRRVLGEAPGENRYIVTVPSRGYRFAADVRIISDNAADPDAASVSTTVLRHDPAGKRKSMIAPGIAAAFLAIVLGVTGVIWNSRKQAHAPARLIIAVLPFKPLVVDHRDESLEMGMADTLIGRLSNIKTLTVRPLSAVRRYHGHEQDPFAAGRELGVDAVLDGYFQRWGGRIRITARLLSVADRKQLWAGQFNDDVEDIFAVQDSISRKVTAELALELTGEERILLTRRYTSDTQAYELYLKGRLFWSHSRLQSTEKAIEFFRQAIRRDPNYSLAYAGLADCYRILPISSDMPAREAFPKAKEAVLKALAIDNQLAEAHSALGWINLWYDWDWPAAESNFQLALRIDPNHIFARLGYAHLLSDLGRNEEALEQADDALRLDPISVFAGTLKGHFLYQARRYPEAIALLHRTLELSPNYWIAQITVGKNYERAGQYEEALESFRKARELSGSSSEPVSLIGYTYAVSSRRAEAEGSLRELKAIAVQRYVPPYYFAVLYHGLGNSTEALHWLEKAYEDRDVHMVFLGVDPKWDSLRTHPGFVRLVRRMKLVA
jgi:DNA-binding winged helix-turn-helix (wHTH) protein/TolB-like protein/Flp pilus assembly protein TadD